MKLYTRVYGEGIPLLILHGLFGQSDNWNSLGKQFAEQGLKAVLIDQRNHGLSPHSDIWNYDVMSNDLLELMEANNLTAAILLGHSMGGKTAMKFALYYPDKLSKLIVADMAPKYYPQHHGSIIAGLQSVNFNTLTTRKEVDAALLPHIPDFGTRQFLLKNIYWSDSGKLQWRFNLEAITANIENMGESLENEKGVFTKPALFLRGDRSDYVKEEDISLIQQLFPAVSVQTIPNSGHWVHAEQPKAFFDAVMQFISQK